MKVDLILRSLTPISHNHPEVNSESNILVFRRVRKLAFYPSAMTIDGEEWKALCQEFSERYPVPDRMLAVLENEPSFNLCYFIAMVLMWEFLEVYNAMGSVGMLRDANRYEILRSRCQDAAIRADSLLSFWTLLTGSLRLPLLSQRATENLILFWELPAYCQRQVLRYLDERSRDIVVLARFLYSKTREGFRVQKETETALAGLFPNLYEDKERESWHPVPLPWLDRRPSETAYLHYIPEVSALSFRHYLREVGFWHMCQRLGLDKTDVREALVPPFVEYFFRCGGALKPGSKAPQNDYYLRTTVRSRYPLVDLFGGNLMTFDLRASCLSMAAWLLCQENRDSIPKDLHEWLSVYPHWNLSYNEFLDHATHYRAFGTDNENESGMPYHFEVLRPNTYFVLRLFVRPQACELTVSALASLVAYAFSGEYGDAVTGRSAYGYGWMEQVAMRISPEEEIFSPEPYEQYLAQFRDELRQGLCDGTFLTGKVLVPPEVPRNK